MDRRELGDRQIAERRGEEVVDQLAIAFMCFRRDFFPQRGQPCGQPLANRDPGRVNVFAGIERAQQTAHLFFVALAAPPHPPPPALPLSPPATASSTTPPLQKTRY